MRDTSGSVPCGNWVPTLSLAALGRRPLPGSRKHPLPLALSCFLLCRANQHLVDRHAARARHNVLNRLGDVLCGQRLHDRVRPQGLLAHLLTDVALHQLFRERYGLVHNVEPAYVEAKVPGLQAASMKVYRQMALGSTVSLPLAIGTLDSAAVFSPTQAMIDLEVNEAVHKFYRGMEVDDKTMCLDLIRDLEFCADRTYLESEHTLRHFRQLGWNPRLFDRAACDHAGPANMGDEGLLAEADRTWRELVTSQPPVEREKAFVDELDRIVAAARNDLLRSTTVTC